MSDHSFGWRKVNKIRKQRQCFGCSSKFPVGTSMFVSAQACDGKVYTDYWCELCEARTRKFDITDWECFSAGDFTPQSF